MALGGLRRLASSPVSTVLGFVLHTPALARAPIGLYQSGFGWLLGSRMLMLEHTGRKSGLARYVVLEVLTHPAPQTYVVAAGFGEHAQWFRNVMADPHVRLWTGRRSAVPAQARRLPQADADSVLQDYIDRHPQAWSKLEGVMKQSLGGRVEPPGTELPLVELTVRQP